MLDKASDAAVGFQTDQTQASLAQAASSFGARALTRPKHCGSNHCTHMGAFRFNPWRCTGNTQPTTLKESSYTMQNALQNHTIHILLTYIFRIMCRFVCVSLCYRSPLAIVPLRIQACPYLRLALSAAWKPRGSVLRGRSRPDQGGDCPRPGASIPWGCSCLLHIPDMSSMMIISIMMSSTKIITLTIIVVVMSATNYC